MCADKRIIIRIQYEQMYLLQVKFYFRLPYFFSYKAQHSKKFRLIAFELSQTQGASYTKYFHATKFKNVLFSNFNLV